MTRISIMLDAHDISAIDYLVARHNLNKSSAVRFAVRLAFTTERCHKLAKMALEMSEASRARLETATVSTVHARWSAADATRVQGAMDYWDIQTQRAAIRFLIRASAMADGWTPKKPPRLPRRQGSVA